MSQDPSSHQEGRYDRSAQSLSPIDYHSCNDDDECTGELRVVTHTLTSPPPFSNDMQEYKSHRISFPGERRSLWYNDDPTNAEKRPLQINDYTDPDDIDTQVVTEENEKRLRKAPRGNELFEDREMHKPYRQRHMQSIIRSYSFQEGYEPTSHLQRECLSARSAITEVYKDRIKLNARFNRPEEYVTHHSSKSLGEYPKILSPLMFPSRTAIQPSAEPLECNIIRSNNVLDQSLPECDGGLKVSDCSSGLERRMHAKKEAVAEFFLVESNYKKKITNLQNILYNFPLFCNEKKRIIQLLGQMIDSSTKIINHGGPNNGLPPGSAILMTSSEFKSYCDYTKEQNSLTSVIRSSAQRNSLANSPIFMGYSMAALPMQRNSHHHRDNQPQTSTIWNQPYRELEGRSLKDAILFPIQHLMNMQLNIKAILEKSREDDSDYEENSKAMSWLKEFNDAINRQQAIEDSMVKMFELKNEIIDCPIDIVSGNRRWIMVGDAIQCATFDKNPCRVRLHVFNDLILVSKLRYPENQDIRKLEKSGFFVQPSYKVPTKQHFWYVISREGISQLVRDETHAHNPAFGASEVEIAKSIQHINIDKKIIDIRRQTSDKHKYTKELPRFSLSMGFDGLHLRTDDRKILHYHSKSSSKKTSNNFASMARMSSLSVAKSQSNALPSVPLFGKLSPSSEKTDGQLSRNQSVSERKRNSIFGSLLSRRKSKVDTTERLDYSGSTADFGLSKLSLVSKSSNSTAQTTETSGCFEQLNSDITIQFRFIDPKYRDGIYEELHSRVQEQNLLHGGPNPPSSITGGILTEPSSINCQ